MRSTPHHRARRDFLLLTAAAVAMPGLSLAAGAGTERIGGRAFATTWSVTAPTGSGIARLRGPIARLLATVDRQMSPWRPDSEITAVNRGGAGRHPVSADTATVCRAALGIARASGGRFDPTVGPLVARWGFGPIEGDAAGGWRDLTVDGGTVGKARAGLTIDLCGIAKGWALDRMAALVSDAGHRDALLDLGGEMRGLGAHPSGRPWRVAVEDPRGPGHPAAAALTLADRAVATSGLAWQSYGLGGRVVGHIVDPGNRQPAGGALRSVSVVHDAAMDADAWATALFAAGADGGPRLARARGLSALFLIERDGALVPETTGAMDRMLP